MICWINPPLYLSILAGACPATLRRAVAYLRFVLTREWSVTHHIKERVEHLIHQWPALKETSLIRCLHARNQHYHWPKYHQSESSARNLDFRAHLIAKAAASPTPFMGSESITRHEKGNQVLTWWTGSHLLSNNTWPIWLSHISRLEMETSSGQIQVPKQDCNIQMTKFCKWLQ